MQLFYKIYIFVLYVLSTCNSIFSSFRQKLKKNIKNEEIKELSETDLYIQNQKQKFIDTFNNSEKDKCAQNANIGEELYSLDSLSNILLQENNEFELTWKRRMMMENTPRGNIIMYYDMFKQAFAYASDNQAIPYSILNACAMKYVILFKCRDFFMDTEILPEGIISPFALLQEEKERKEKEKIEEKKKDLGINFKNAPFAKLKNYRPVGFITADDNKNGSNQHATVLETNKLPVNSIVATILTKSSNDNPPKIYRNTTTNPPRIYRGRKRRTSTKTH
jgi:hypothetical protein